MTQAQAGATATHQQHLALILRLSWDSLAQQWRILVKPAAGDETRLFGDIEAAFSHVETLMAARVQRCSGQTMAARSIPNDELEERDR